MRSKIAYPNFIFFEEARYPILTVEVAIPVAGASVRNGRPPTTNETLASMSLAGVNLHQSSFNAHLSVGLDQLKTRFAGAWRDLKATVRVCEDTTSTGVCSDKTKPKLLSINGPSFTLGYMPTSLTVEVWSGRTFTLAHDPQLCEKQYSPLVLDMTKAGFKFSGPENGVYFDLNDTGQAIATGWTASNNLAFLVRDVDGNGNIESGADLFGSATVLKNGNRATNGFEALRDLDDNGDLRFSPADRAWSSVKLWFDRNRNGRLDPNELVTLDQMGIEYINLTYIEVMEMDRYGNQTRQRSTFHRNVRGKSQALQIIDAWFNTLGGF